MREVYTLKKLFDDFPGGICVPRIQRGYVQGRVDEKGNEIEKYKKFAINLVDAVFEKKELSLDFIYGVATRDNEAKRCLLPLDGQQRLSTLFLLAWLCRKWEKDWSFTYESRRIPQFFVKGLREHQREADGKPSEEIENAGWFLPIWKEDPSVAGMLRMLDTLHEVIGERNRADADFGHVTFLLHGIDGRGDTFDHIFRKMNARGKELSPWENMKAMLDKYVPQNFPIDWRDKIDGDWAECIWHAHQHRNDPRKYADEKIVNLDNAMEKIVRMAYVRFVSYCESAAPDNHVHRYAVEAQKDSLWEIEKTLDTNSEEACKFFFQTTTDYFQSLKTLAGGFTLAQCWTDNRRDNVLWGKTSDEKDFWEWLFDGDSASAANLLRMAFLAEKVHEGVEDDQRRRRILLNLLDASSINKENFAKALDAGLGFIAGDLDLKDIKSRQAGYSREQLEDEEWKYSFESGDIAMLECNPLVWRGSMAFLGQMPPNAMSDSLTKLSEAINENDKQLFLDILGLSGKFNTGLPCKTVKIPKKDMGTWAEECFSTSKMFFRDGIAAWLQGNHYDTSNGSSTWINYLDSIWNIIERKDLMTIAIKDAGWLFCVGNKKLTNEAIRLAKSQREYENMKNLKEVQISESDTYYLSWAVLPYDGFMEDKRGCWYWNVKLPSWWKSDEPPKYIHDSTGFHEIPQAEG